jgi:hypothetical protein
VFSHELVSAYAALFVERFDQYAVQQPSGSYWRVVEPLTGELLTAHLSGSVTLGTYLLDEHGQCSFAVFDADTEDGLEKLVVLAGELASQGIPILLEASRRGGHLWVHLSTLTPAQVVRTWLLPYARACDVELYPKQDTIVVGGSGSLIRVPLGIHRRSRGWYPFLQLTPDGELVPVGETVMACCMWAIEHVERIQAPDDAWSVLTPVSYSHSIPAISDKQEGRMSIRSWCRSQDVMAIMSQYVSLNRQGVGSCPFKEHHHRGDVRPSFHVFPESDQCWYCYTWARGGDLFDFLCLYHGLTPREGYQRLRQETLLPYISQS